MSSPPVVLADGNDPPPPDAVDTSSAAAAASVVPQPSGVRWKGFVAGIMSGLTKLTIGHPFDSIKVRMQCSELGTYKGPLDCLQRTVKYEGLRALYKGATPPAFGWAASDAILLGSLHNYRLMFARIEGRNRGEDVSVVSEIGRLSLGGHAAAGAMAGWTVCTFIIPFEHLKAKLQMQTVGPKLYTGPIDCAKQIVRANGVTGLWRGFGGTLLFRSFCSYEILMRKFRDVPIDSPYRVSEGTANFLAGGLSSNVFWIGAFPFDAVKNRLMTDSPTNPRYPSWMAAARQIWAEGGVRAVYRGFVPCLLRAFPTNASALFVWETSMRLMGAEQLKK
ncbi:BZ3500_MvSof-1268-A1-R1_Chr1-1g00886 [Microbotryum saponariae]|uniref:BZ3500_MvSof-1268-A1-R1_Chr1-1g00886 protein n=1 Tax=Microbotryum saponariae TaxID=289078 RepID=A0A2X0MFD4_9BASI|nr:BZ3500_MvSof-1268-A1-R1_Chr1-1g00886 [Microbotryum saponariae]SCZ92860.1 BZ3501_MvSof-1269-A2-R1_Chr1-1g00483 [Microbotryum saponariae]